MHHPANETPLLDKLLEPGEVSTGALLVPPPWCGHWKLPLRLVWDEVKPVILSIPIFMARSAPYTAGCVDSVIPVYNGNKPALGECSDLSAHCINGSTSVLAIEHMYIHKTVAVYHLIHLFCSF